MKKIFSDYIRGELTSLVAETISAVGGERHQDELLEQFIDLSEYPSGSDLILYLEDEQDDSVEGIVHQVQEWRKANGKPGFRDE